MPLETCSATTSKARWSASASMRARPGSMAVERDVLVGRDGLVAHLPMMPHHAAMALDVRTSIASGLVLERLPALDGLTPLDAAERLRDLPGLVLLESARPGHRARWSYLAVDPVAVLERPDDGPDPFAGARQLLGRLAPTRIDAATTGSIASRRVGRGEPGGQPPSRAGPAAWQAISPTTSDAASSACRAWRSRTSRCRSCASGCTTWWSPGTGTMARPGWSVGRWTAISPAFIDGVRPCSAGCWRPAPRSSDRRARSLEPRRPAAPGAAGSIPGTFVADLDRPTFEAMVERVRDEIARGEIYQANVARRLVAPFDGDPWLVYRRLADGRPGDPCRVSRPRAAAGAPVGEPGAVPGARCRRAGGHRPHQGHAAARRHARARTAPSPASCWPVAKDRAENVMIVDVLRNDLGRVCVRGTIRVPRLCRLERTGAVQHLVSTVTGRLSPERDAFDLLAAAFPGGSITGAPKIRAMEVIESLEPVRRGPYTGAARVDRCRRRDGLVDPHPHVRGRRRPPDAARRRRHDLALRPGRGVRGDRGQGARPALGHRRRRGRAEPIAATARTAR